MGRVKGSGVCRASPWQRTTNLRRFARKLAENANASGRKIGARNTAALSKMGYFLHFVRTLGFGRRLLRM